MKEKLKENKKIIIGILLIVIIFATVGGVYLYKSAEHKKMVKDLTSQIQSTYDNFTNSENRDEKLEDLKSFLNEYEKYKKTDKPIEEIVAQYEKHLINMKKYFTDEYEKIISENSLEKIEEEKDKEKITTAKNNLTTLSETITNEIDIICSKEDAEIYTNKITETITSYTNRITSIEEQEKKEAEEKAKQEAEEKARQEAQQAQSSNNYSSNGGDYSYSSGDGYSSYSNSGGNYGGGTYYNPDGSVGGGWTTDSSGNRHHYDNEGNTWTDDDLKEWLD